MSPSVNVHRVMFDGLPRQARICQVCGQEVVVEDLL